MNILIITPSFPNPGNLTEGLFNAQQAQALKKAGNNIIVILCKPIVPEYLAKKLKRYEHLSHLPECEERDGIFIIYNRFLQIPHYSFPSLTAYSCAHSMIKTLRKMGLEKLFDVIQVHGTYPTGLAAPIVSQKISCPYILTLHIQDNPRIFRSPKSATLYQNMLEKASALITVGSPLERFLKNILPEQNQKICKTIHNGVEISLIDEILKEMVPNNNGWGHIISISNLWPIKGIDINLRALAQLRDERVPWRRYTIIGEGPERAGLEKLAKELKIDDRVVFLGRLIHQDTLRELARADIFCLPSWQESFGVVYLEAMAMGKPTIGCQGEGAEDIIRDGNDGLLLPPKDPTSLAGALKRLIQDPEFAISLGKNAKLRARQFTWERNVEAYIEIYQSIINSRRP
jgi:teichuronic acid biosynthesis glycosyltransferase TuaC